MPVSLWQFDRRGGPTPAGTVGQLQLPDNAIDTKDEQATQAHEPQRDEGKPLQRAEQMTAPWQDPPHPMTDGMARAR
jgi:hypothetical protein